MTALKIGRHGLTQPGDGEVIPMASRPTKESHWQFRRDSAPRNCDPPVAQSARWWVVAFCAGLALYVSTMCRNVLWGDPGELQAHTAGAGWYMHGQIARSHVVFVALARTVHSMCNLSPAMAANLCAALGGALTIANVAWLLSRLCKSRIAVATGASVLLFSHTLWQLSTGAEVITISTALLSAELIGIERFIATSNARWLGLAALCNGLGASNHNFSLLMWPVYVYVAVTWIFRAESRGRSVRLCAIFAAGVLVGMLPVLALCVDHWKTNGSLTSTLRSLLVGTYGAQVVNLARLPQLCAKGILFTVFNFPTPLLLGAILGWRTLRRQTPHPLFVMIVGALVVFGAFGMRYDVADQYTFLAPAFMYLAFPIGAAVDSVVSRGTGLWRSAAMAALVFLGPLVYWLAPVAVANTKAFRWVAPQREVPYRRPAEWFLRPWRVGYDGAEKFARETLAALPPNAWLTADRTTAMPIHYLQTVEGLRRDVRLEAKKLLQPWRVVDDSDRAAAITQGLVYATSDNPTYMVEWLQKPGYRFQPSGLVFQVLQDETP